MGYNLVLLYLLLFLLLPIQALQPIPGIKFPYFKYLQWFCFLFWTLTNNPLLQLDYVNLGHMPPPVQKKIVIFCKWLLDQQGPTSPKEFPLKLNGLHGKEADTRLESGFYWQGRRRDEVLGRQPVVSKVPHLARNEAKICVQVHWTRNTALYGIV